MDISHLETHQLPHMLVMRNKPNGMIWQAYTVSTELERRLIATNATRNGLIVSVQPVGYTEESSPGWQTSTKWLQCKAQYENHIAQTT